MDISSSRFEGNVGEETKNATTNIIFCCRCQRMATNCYRYICFGWVGQKENQINVKVHSVSVRLVGEKSSKLNTQIIKKIKYVEGMQYPCENLEAVPDQMQQLDGIFKMIFDVQKE